MTGISILRQAYSLMEKPEGMATEESLESGLLAVNQIYSELWHREHRSVFVPLDTLRQRLELSWRCMPAMAYGTAMLLCLNGGEDLPYDRFLERYQRAAAHTGSIPYRRKDSLPREEDGEWTV